ncbi:serine/threonine-protein kinase PkaB-like [Penaeus monodon]|uniref:serine/threonine-protein kinase PkaB-like n=1 Tax=Penaeus monodon TaxID=6687 RepID=UPI0018A72A36|nr:serine/threonine-protein kinase PkaB-like [Penaeus monodon]
MTYCRGRDLSVAVDQEPSDRASLGIMLRTCQALRQVHQAGFVHCDLKPDNVLLELDADGEPQEVHVVDLGLACRVGHSYPRAAPVTRKPYFCACFFDGSPVQARCDVVGLAATLAFFRNAMSREHEELDALLQRASAAQHERRPSLEELIALLQRLLREAGAQLPSCCEAAEAQQPAGAASVQDASEAAEAREVPEAVDLGEMCRNFRAMNIFRR